MKIEKLTENKIRIVVKLEELKDSNFNVEDFMMSNVESQKFLLDILNRAEKEVGFKTQNCKLLVEGFSSLDDVFVFTITKFAVTKKKRKNFKLQRSKKSHVLKNPIYQFSTFEEFCCFCEVLKKSNIPISSIAKKVSLYLYNNTYYLVFYSLNLNYKNFKKLFSFLSEFAIIVRRSSNFEAKLFEYGKAIKYG